MENPQITNPDVSINPTPTIQSPASSQTKSRLIVPVLLTVLVCAIIFGLGGYYLGTQSLNSNNTYLKDEKPIESVATQTSPTPTTNSNLNVLTYSDEEYQFSFQYPKDWKLNCTKPQDNNWLDRNICDITALSTSLDHGELLSGAYFTIGVSKPNPNYSSFQEYIKYSVDQHGYKAMPKTINNIQGYELISSSNSVFVFERKGYFISVGGTPLETTKPYYADIQEIISSFRLNNE
ncbi:MAG: PsbP-related protein [Patescibacteria group bacterium]